MSWHKIALTNDQVVAGEHMRLQDAFEAIFMATLAQRDAAMFGRSLKAGGDELYFSPAASKVAESLIRSGGGVPCAPPPKDGTDLLVGHAGAHDALLR